MGIFQAVGRGFSASIKFISVIIIFFVFNFLIGLAMLPFVGPENAGKPQATAVTIVLSIISVLVFIFLQGGVLGLIKDLLKNNSFSLSDFAANGKKYYVKIMGLLIAILVVAFIMIIILALISSAVLAISNTTFTRALLTAIIIVISLVAVVLLLFPIYIIILEERGPVAALKKGIRLGMKYFWKVLGLFLALLIFAFLIAFVVGILTALISGALPVKVGQIIILFVNSLLQSYLSIVMMIAFMAYYLGLSPQEDLI